MGGFLGYKRQVDETTDLQVGYLFTEAREVEGDITVGVCKEYEEVGRGDVNVIHPSGR